MTRDELRLEERLNYIKDFDKRRAELKKKEERKRILMEAHRRAEELREINEVLIKKEAL